MAMIFRVKELYELVNVDSRNSKTLSHWERRSMSGFERKLPAFETNVTQHTASLC